VRELTARSFSEGGWLEEFLELEHRPQQETMARAAASAFAEDHSLLFEAGTGVGKSLAYLIPGILHACEQKRQMIVSTHTISLQEQLEQKDLPLCRRVFRSVEGLKGFADFKSTVLVGKGNYLCNTRLSHAIRDKQELFSNPEFEELARIARWAATSTTGLRHELNPPPLPEVWEHVSAESAACSRKHCTSDACFYQRAKARVRSAQVVIVNHALLFALINVGGPKGEGATRGVLLADDFVVLDEAHTVAEVATDHFGMHLSSYGVDRLLKHLYNPKTRKGLLAKHGSARDRARVETALEASAAFFEHLSTRLLAERPIARVREAGAAEPLLDQPLKELFSSLDDIATRLQEGRDFDEVAEQRDRVQSYRGSLTRWLAVADESEVYWTERGGRRGQIIELRTAPLDVAPQLREALFGRNTSVLCTSATLAIAGEISIMQARLGAEAAQTGIEKSPFDYEKAMRVYVAADMPLPSEGEARLALPALADWVSFCSLACPGGSLVLFTSHRDMKSVAELIEPDLAAAKRPFLVQGRDGSRTELTRLMREAGNAVLFGTDSFWTGVDVPGSALSQVIITRLPFDTPTHPVAQARSEHIAMQGRNPFNELTLPDAVMKFRQGIGRLIRTSKDRGVVTLLDARVLAKSYGRLFLGALPQPAWEKITRADRALRFRA
jgi:ATP-dependent DNA helicase DinG